MENPSLYKALTLWAETQPHAPFVVEVETRRTLTYAECLREVRGLQDVLGPGQRTVAAALPGGITAAVVWLSALLGGHCLVPCSPDAADDEKGRLASRFNPDVLIVEQPEQARGFGCADAMVLTPSSLEATLAQMEPTTADTNAGAERSWPREGTVCLTTSGTTGLPKGVRLRSSQIAWTAEQIRQSHRLGREDRGLCVLPFFHINAPVVSLGATLMAGATVIIAPRFSRSNFWSWIEQDRITWASVVPAILARLLQTDVPSSLPGTLRFIRTASAPLPVVQLRAFEERFGIPVVETYGLSEAASQVAANPVPPGRRKAGSVGLPTGVALRICQPRGATEDSGLRDVLPGAEGEICVAGPSVIPGYDRGVGTAAFTDGWFRTGDLGYQDEAGYVYISGRIGDVINRGGEKIAPREIEEVLLAHPDVDDVAVVGKPDPVYGQRVVAYVVTRTAYPPNLESNLRTYCAQRLSPYKVPVGFVQVAELPRTRTGKIQRRRLVAELAHSGAA